MIQMDFCERDFFLLRIALAYAKANVDDVNDEFAPTTEEDPQNESGRIRVDGITYVSPTGDEFAKLLSKFTDDLVANPPEHISDVQMKLHQEEQRHQKTKWKYADALQREQRWKEAFKAAIRAMMPESDSLREES